MEIKEFLSSLTVIILFITGLIILVIELIALAEDKTQYQISPQLFAEQDQTPPSDKPKTNSEKFSSLIPDFDERFQEREID